MFVAVKGLSEDDNDVGMVVDCSSFVVKGRCFLFISVRYWPSSSLNSSSSSSSSLIIFSLGWCCFRELTGSCLMGLVVDLVCG